MSEKMLIVNAVSGATVERELTKDEESSRKAEAEALLSEELNRENAKVSAIAKLEKLGLTVEEVEAVFGLSADV